MSTKWVTLKDMKNSYTVQMAKYALQRCIAGNIEFTWWIRHVLVKSNRITGKLKSKYWVRMHKSSVNIPSQYKRQGHLMKKMAIPFGGKPYAKKINDQTRI